MIACVLIRHFAAAVEQRDKPALLHTPVILQTDEKVYATCARAQAAGITPGMPLRKAALLCPTAQVIPAAPSRYRYVFGQILKILCEFTPLIEPGNDAWQSRKSKRRSHRSELPAASGAQTDAVFYFNLKELSPTDTPSLAKRVIEAVQKQSHFAASVGLANGKFPAFIAAARAEPRSELLIPAGGEAAFLADQPIALLPLDEEICRRLRLLGIQTLGQFAQLPSDPLSTRFRKASSQPSPGPAKRPIVPYRPGAVARVTHRFDSPVKDRQTLAHVLRTIATELADRLRSEGQMGRSLELVLSLEDGAVRRQLILRQPTANAEHLALTLGQMLTQTRLRGGVQTLEVSLSDLVPAARSQLTLFGHQGGQEKLLRADLNDVITSYSVACFYWINLAGPKSRLPVTPE